MSICLDTERRKRGLPPYRREVPRWRYWTTREIAIAALTTEGAVQQRVRRGQFAGALKVSTYQGWRWLVPDAPAREFVARHRAKGLAS